MRLEEVDIPAAWVHWGRTLEVASDACCSRHQGSRNSLQQDLDMMGRILHVGSGLTTTINYQLVIVYSLECFPYAVIWQRSKTLIDPPFRMTVAQGEEGE